MRPVAALLLAATAFLASALTQHLQCKPTQAFIAGADRMVVEVAHRLYPAVLGVTGPQACASYRAALLRQPLTQAVQPAPWLPGGAQSAC
jgi:hypothetical protein